MKYSPDTQLYGYRWHDPFGDAFQGPVIELRVYLDPAMKYPERIPDQLQRAVWDVLRKIEEESPA